MDPSRQNRTSAGPMLSLEATLDEENKKVLETLARQRSDSPNVKKSRNRTPPPYRSMLDVGDPAPRHGSIAGIGVGITSPRDRRKPSKRLDPGDPSTWTKPANTTSPIPTRATPAAAPPGTGIGQGLPRIEVDPKQSFEQMFNFDMESMPLSGGGAIQTTEKKVREGSSGGAKPNTGDIRSPQNLRSPVSNNRSSSPKIGMLSPESPRRKPGANTGRDDSARRLSNKSSSFSTADESDEASTRVLADADGDEDAVVESSSDDDAEKQRSSSDDDSGDDERGRKRSQDDDATADEPDSPNTQRLAPQSQGVKSLIEPLMSPSLPHDRSADVHPPSSFGRSGPTAADFASEDEYEAEIRKAKNMGLSLSPVDDSIQDRHVRMIIRGEWAKFQDEEENNNNLSPRLYLACTDLSTEASYAMEWTVGTMLRDGDTLLAIYAIEDETAPKEPEGNTQVMTESAKAAQDASDAMEALTRQTTDIESKPMTKFIPAIDAPLAGSTNLSGRSRKEVERIKALDEITQNFLKLVRKTPLQIRCMIEVIHCKSPKHLILNAIDELEPTLCVVGTRGRSSLKGVLLGSFSNYLVTKSSVPVMVARKRLKKPHHAKVNSSSIRLANNLGNSIASRGRRNLASARID